MSHVFGIATKIKVKKTAPSSLFELLDYAYALGQFESSESQSQQLTTIQTHSDKMRETLDMLNSILITSYCDGYMGSWCWRVKEDAGDYWLYESRASNRSPGTKEFLSLLMGCKEHLVLEDGDILFRSVYEESSVEDILYYSKDAFHEKEGQQYETDHGYVHDGDHPYNEKVSQADKAKLSSGELTHTQRLEYGEHLLWTIAEIDAKVAKEKLRVERAWKATRARNGYGFS